MQLSIYRNINSGDPHTELKHSSKKKYIAYTLPQPRLMADGWVWFLDSFFLSLGDVHIC